MNTEELNTREILEMEEKLSGKEKASKHGVDRKLLLEGIKNLSRISSCLQIARVEHELIKDEKKQLLKLMESAAKKQDDLMDLKSRGYIGIFNHYSPEVISADNAPICLKIEEFNQMSYKHQIPAAEMYHDPTYYHELPSRYR